MGAQGKNLEAGTDAEAVRLASSWSNYAAGLPNPERAAQEWYHKRMHPSTSIININDKSPQPSYQSVNDQSTFSIKVSSSQMPLVCVNLTKKLISIYGNLLDNGQELFPPRTSSRP